jgi:predicted DCC family thiol-disulfide oxidoreductase YuxK
MMMPFIAFIDPIPGRRVVLYDGSCKLCVRCRRFINLFDWFRRFTWLDFRDSQVMARVNFVTAEHLEREMVVIDKTGQLHSGFAGWRAILSRIPVSFLFVWPLYFPLITALGERLYRTVSAHRFAPKRCGNGSCQLEGPSLAPTPGPWCETLSLANERASGASDLPRST